MKVNGIQFNSFRFNGQLETPGVGESSFSVPA
jgi:hypothetical protein